MAEPNSTGQETLEESMERLETILDTLEGDDISLEESFALYQKGMKLVQSCKEKIDHLAVDLSACQKSLFDKLVDGGASSPATTTPTQVLLEPFGFRPQNL